uniref:Uncharacterized protein n=1 Tax=Setaria italica TaxID=4555 RepID=K3Z163_SETIT
MRLFKVHCLLCYLEVPMMGIKVALVILAICVPWFAKLKSNTCKIQLVLTSSAPTSDVHKEI